VHPLSPSLDHVGFFARRVDDVALGLSLLAGTSDSDIHGRPVPAFQVSVKQGLPPLPAPRLAIVRFEKWEKAEAEQQAVFDASVATLRDGGALLEELELPELDHANWSTINTILASEAALIFDDLVERYPDRTSDRLKELIQTGKAHSAYDYLAAKELQEKLRAVVASQLSGFDAVLTLPAFGEAPEGLTYTGDAEYCAPWTLLGFPAVSLPAGFGKNGLPLGLQIVGPYREDYRTLRVAKWIETTLKFDARIPNLRRPVV
jgi:amidase